MPRDPALEIGLPPAPPKRESEESSVEEALTPIDPNKRAAEWLYLCDKKLKDGTLRIEDINKSPDGLEIKLPTYVAPLGGPRRFHMNEAYFDLLIDTASDLSTIQDRITEALKVQKSGAPDDHSLPLLVFGSPLDNRPLFTLSLRNAMAKLDVKPNAFKIADTNLAMAGDA